MKYLYLLLTALFLLLCFTTQSQTYSGRQPNTTTTSKNIQEKNQSQNLKKQASELTAKHIPLTKLETDGVARAKLEEYKEQVNMENLLFPADELYNSNWDTIHVNPFVSQKINFPESYTVNCNSFIMPISNDDIKVTSKYGPRRRRMHRGIDLKVQIGDTIRAAFDGKVRIKSYERRGYGYYVVMRHPNGLETVYGHLSKFLVKENDIIRAGEPIALGGNTGRSTGSHLHFETRFLGIDINPADIIDFENGQPYKDEYVFNNVKINGKASNIYTSSDNAYAIHRVKQGETLSGIAQKYGTTVNELCRLNSITNKSKLAIGQQIRFQTKQIKVQATEEVVKQIDTKNNNPVSTANLNSNNGKSDKIIETPIEKTVADPDAPLFHEIEKGDTLFSLSKKYGISIEKLCKLNNFEDNVIIKVGQKIRCS
jgi:murein DD-endopeptidase MepM/ murein hydrolase activator NlpD